MSSTTLPSNWPGLSKGTQSRILSVNDLEIHILEANPPSIVASESKPPLVVLLHGFPELAYSWRKVIGPLSEAGYHVVAPDQRGVGRTRTIPKGGTLQSESTPVRYEDDLAPFRMTNRVNDVVMLVHALGYNSVAAVVGHDFGSPLAGYCALIRPDIFKSVVLMSAPFTGPPKPSLGLGTGRAALDFGRVVAALAALTPPRKSYTLYGASPEANGDMLHPPGGLGAFMRELYHVKSADWDHSSASEPVSAPHALPVLGDAAALADMMAGALPRYYVMRRDESLPQAIHALRVGPSVAADETIKPSAWLTDEELDVYVTEHARAGLQGGLNGYRIAMSAEWSADCLLFAGKRLDVPAMFVSGKEDWGTYQFPGAADLMRGAVCTHMATEDFVLIDGAGHWVQQEQSEKVVEHLLRFLGKCAQ
ncbi:alpha/beta-hydrolase [Mycena galericulata]|nr:alpha/beta-hydrolase [Mycena galericulata]